MPALGLGGRLPSLESRPLAPRTVCGRVDKSALAVTRHAPHLPGCGLDTPGCSLLTTTGTALGTTVHGRDDCTRVHLAIARPGVTSSDRLRSGKRSWQPGRSHWDCEEAVVASCDRGNSGSTVEPALRLWVAPSLFPRPFSRTSSGCSSACLGPWGSRMWLQGLCCRLLVSLVLGCCLAPPPR